MWPGLLAAALVIGAGVTRADSPVGPDSANPVLTERAIPIPSADELLRGARALFKRGHYRQALELVEGVKAASGSAATPQLRMSLYETEALIRLALGDHGSFESG